MRSFCTLLLVICLSCAVALVGANPPVPSAVRATGGGSHGRFWTIPSGRRPENNQGKPFSGDDTGSELAPTNPTGTPRAAGIVNDASQPRITNHGGGVMTSTSIPLYYIFYGTWTGTGATAETLATPAVLQNFGADIKSSAWLSIVKQGYGASAAAGWSAGNSIYRPIDAAYGGVAMSDANIQQLVVDVLNANLLPTSSNAIYMVITSPDVTATSGFCTNYCGWHTAMSFKPSSSTTTTVVKYAFIGAARRCMSSCSGTGDAASSPNRNPSADAMVSIMAHEIAETLTDPQMNAWYDAKGNENADKCAWTFGNVKTDSVTHSYYNVVLGTSSRKYLIQRNWVIRSSTVQGCGLSVNG